MFNLNHTAMSIGLYNCLNRDTQKLPKIWKALTFKKAPQKLLTFFLFLGVMGWSCFGRNLILRCIIWRKLQQEVQHFPINKWFKLKFWYYFKCIWVKPGKRLTGQKKTGLNFLLQRGLLTWYNLFGAKDCFNAKAPT